MILMLKEWKKILFFILFCFTATNYCMAQGISWNFSLGGNEVLYLNEGREYIEKGYSTFESSLMWLNKKRNLAFGLSGTFLSDNSSIDYALQVPPLVEDEREALLRTVGHIFSFNLGLAIEHRIRLNKSFKFIYGINVGPSFTYRTSYQFDYSPFDTIAAGYSSTNVKIYTNPDKMGISGFYINPYFKIAYLFIDDVGFITLGINSHFNNTTLYSVYEVLPNTASEPTITFIEEKSILWGVGWDIGFIVDIPRK